MSGRAGMKWDVQWKPGTTAILLIMAWLRDRCRVNVSFISIISVTFCSMQDRKCQDAYTPPWCTYKVAKPGEQFLRFLCVMVTLLFELIQDEIPSGALVNPS